MSIKSKIPLLLIIALFHLGCNNSSEDAIKSSKNESVTLTKSIQLAEKKNQKIGFFILK